MKNIQKIVHFIEDVIVCNDEDIELEMMEEDMYMSLLDINDSENKNPNYISADIRK